jgi:hypothetical protein
MKCKFLSVVRGQDSIGTKADRVVQKRIYQRSQAILHHRPLPPRDALCGHDCDRTGYCRYYIY